MDNIIQNQSLSIQASYEMYMDIKSM